MNSEEQQSINTIYEKIQEIATESIGGDFIYRGEPQHTEDIKSKDLRIRKIVL